jgi:Xaa-Pro aminopeptidase
MPMMSASGPSAAEPHYVPRRGACRTLNDHPIYMLDSGGQYLGGSTDNTIAVALGPPEPKHVLAHTLVLKGYIALAMARFPAGTLAVHLDCMARQPLWREGMDYAHGTGHGVGNYLNIHEGPVIRREVVPVSTVALEAGMIVTNEPGYYAAGDFGLRIESHMAVIASAHPGFLEFETISRLPIDPRLVDFERLEPAERHWLAEYHRRVLDDVGPLLDGASLGWLQRIVRAFTPNIRSQMS